MRFEEGRNSPSFIDIITSNLLVRIYDRRKLPDMFSYTQMQLCLIHFTIVGSIDEQKSDSELLVLTLFFIDLLTFSSFSVLKIH